MQVFWQGDEGDFVARAVEQDKRVHVLQIDALEAVAGNVNDFQPILLEVGETDLVELVVIQVQFGQIRQFVEDGSWEGSEEVAGKVEHRYEVELECRVDDLLQVLNRSLLHVQLNQRRVITAFLFFLPVFQSRLPITRLLVGLRLQFGQRKLVATGFIVIGNCFSGPVDGRGVDGAGHSAVVPDHLNNNEWMA